MNQRAYIAILISVVASGLLAWAGSTSGSTFNGWPVYGLCVLLAFVIQWVVFVPSYIKQTEHFYDLTGSITYITVTLFALGLTPELSTSAKIIGALIIIWAARLGSFLFIRVRQDQVDARFDDIKPNPIRFFSVWTIQGMWISITAAAGLVAICSAKPHSLTMLEIIGIAVWIIGFAIEAISDRQKRVFRKKADKQTPFIQEGLWAYSRHPNYFGEIVLWVGIAIIAIPSLSGWQFATLISPVFVFLLLTKVSGVPLLEKSADEKWSGEPAYENYKKEVPVLFPRLTKPSL